MSIGVLGVWVLFQETRMRKSQLLAISGPKDYAGRVQASVNTCTLILIGKSFSRQ